MYVYCNNIIIIYIYVYKCNIDNDRLVSGSKDRYEYIYLYICKYIYSTYIYKYIIFVYLSPSLISLLLCHRNIIIWSLIQNNVIQILTGHLLEVYIYIFY